MNNGYFTIQNNRFKLTTVVTATIIRSDGLWAGYSVFPRITTAGYVDVYVRDASGNLPANNSSIECSFVCYNPQ